MRLLFLTDNFPPEVNAPATRTVEHCREWVARGVAVTVITCAPNFPRGEVYPGYRNRLWQRETIDGIRVIRVWSFIAANQGFLKRIFDYVSFGIMAFLASLFVRTDLIVATSPQFFTAIAGWASAVCKRKPWVMEVRDLWPVSIKAVGAMSGKGRWLSRLEHVELFLYRHATRIVVVTNSFREDLIGRGVDPAKIAVVTNGVYADQFAPRPKDPDLVRELGLEGKFVVGYVGTFGMAHGLMFILDCAPYAPPSVHFLLIGDGARRPYLEHRLARKAHPNVTLLPAIPKAAIPRHLSVIDAALVNLKRKKVFRTVIPSKIFENAAMGKPILLGLRGESKAIIERYGAGVCYKPESEKEFIDRVTALCEDDELYANCSRQAQVLAADFDRKRLAESMLTVLEAAAGRGAYRAGEHLPTVIRPNQEHL